MLHEPKLIHFVDKLIENGSRESEMQGTTYSYLEFAENGRLHKVSCPEPIHTKFLSALRSGLASCYFVAVWNGQSESTNHIVIGVGGVEGPIYGLNPGVHGTRQAIKSMAAQRRLGYLFLLLGIFASLLGIATLIFVVGLFILPLGISLVWKSRQIIKLANYSITVIKFMESSTRSIPNIKLL